MSLAVFRDGVSSGLVVSRAVVRDQFAGRQAALIFSVTALANAVVPLISPALGALVVSIAPWRAVFLPMFAYALIMLGAVLVAMRETSAPEERASLDPRLVLGRYASLLVDRSFMFPALALGSCVGGIYTLSSGLPFLMIDRLGLSPLAFGAVMAIQTTSYIVGSFVATRLLRRFETGSVAGLGIACVGFGGGLFLLLPHVLAPSVATYMTAVAVWVFGNGLAMPGLTTTALEDRASRIGLASALLGFVQIGIGFLGATILGLAFRDVGLGTTILVPVASFAAVAFHLFRRP